MLNDQTPEPIQQGIPIVSSASTHDTAGEWFPPFAPGPEGTWPDPPQERHPFDELTLGAGLATTALVLLLVYWVAWRSDGHANLFGFYALWIIPFSALLLGVAAGSGYWFVARYRGTRISGRILLIVLAIQLGAYIAGNYIEYRVAMSQVRVLDDGVPFLVYFDARARQSTFGTSNPDAFAPGTSSTLGGWGYAFVLSEMLGFALGSIVPLFGLKKANYCATCQRYLHGSKAAWVPLGLSPREARRQKRVCKKSPRELMGCRTEDDVVRAANQVMGTIWKGIEEDDPALVREALNPYRTKLNARRCLRWATLKIEVCSGCDEGVLTIYESVHQDGQVTKQLRSAFQVSKVIAAAIRA